MVNDVHERYRVIRLRRDNGRIADVRYDSRTEVVYQGQRYRPESLDRGDYVSMRVNRDRAASSTPAREPSPRCPRWLHRDRDRRDDRWDDRRDRDRRDDGWGKSARWTGVWGGWTAAAAVSSCACDRGTVWVSLPYNADRTVHDRFPRLRSGDRVHVSGRYAGNGRFQMDGFR